jgi:hypothetical protein
MMKHFTSEDWIDYVRNVQTADVSAQMKEHLEKCEECHASFQLWASVTKAAAEDLNYSPPSDALRIAKSQFVPSQPSRSFLGELMANLVFDTAQQPLPAGVRSASNVCRQLLYQHGQRFIDLRVEKAPSSEEVSLIGQIQESTSGKQTAIPVVLRCGERIMQQTETNDMGEFHMVFSPLGDLHLELDICEKKIRVRVPEFPDVGK